MNLPQQTAHEHNARQYLASRMCFFFFLFPLCLILKEERAKQG